MARKRGRRKRNRKRKQKVTQATMPTIENNCEVPKQGFVWSNNRIYQLLRSAKGHRPAGLNKHLVMFLIRKELSKRLEMDVPLKHIWDFFNTFYDMRAADLLEPIKLNIEEKDFELPQTEDWKQLIEEELIKCRALCSPIKTETDAIKQANRSVTSNVDLKTLKSVKVMVEKLDSHTILMSCLKSNK